MYRVIFTGLNSLNSFQSTETELHLFFFFSFMVLIVEGEIPFCFSANMVVTGQRSTTGVQHLAEDPINTKACLQTQLPQRFVHSTKCFTMCADNQVYNGFR